MPRILVAGATGFTGRQVIPLLVQRHYEVTCLVRKSSSRREINLQGVKFIEGDIDEQESVKTALQGQNVFLNIAYLIGPKEYQRAEGIPIRAEKMIRACRASGVQRVVFLSSTSVFTTLNVPSKAARLAAEKAIMDSALDCTILRPTMIYGNAGDRNMFRLIQFLRRSPVILVPGSGDFRQQPIYVEDLARAIVACLEVDTTFQKAYNLSGGQPVTFNEIIEQTCQALGIRRLKFHLPLRPTLWALRLLNKLRKRPWLKEEQIFRLNEDKVFSHTEAHKDFGFSPRTFSEGIQKEVTAI